jgi:transcriptional regulator with XRE-family HTH domain
MSSPGAPITPAQCRAARAFLGWNQRELAEKAGVGPVAVNQFETGISEPRRATLEVIRLAFERAGVVFIDENGGGAGLRLRRKSKRQPRSSQT